MILSVRFIASVAFVTEAVDSLVRWHEYVAAPAHVLAIDGPAAVISYRRNVLASHFYLLEAASNVKSLTYVK